MDLIARQDGRVPGRRDLPLAAGLDEDLAVQYDEGLRGPAVAVPGRRMPRSPVVSNNANSPPLCSPVTRSRSGEPRKR
jgi:hypothetical protein